MNQGLCVVRICLTISVHCAGFKNLKAGAEVLVTTQRGLLHIQRVAVTLCPLLSFLPSSKEAVSLPTVH